MANDRSLLSIEQAQEFIKQLAQRMDANSGDKIEIQMGKNSVYEGVVGQEPDMSKLTETRVEVLRAAINMDAPPIEGKRELSNLKQAIILEKNDVPVFQFEKGQVQLSQLVEPQPLQVEQATEIDGVQVVSQIPQEQSPVEVFESVTPFEVVKKEIDVSDLPQDSSVRASTQEFVQHKELQSKLQQEETSKNWQWFQVSRLEDRQGAYQGSVSIEAIQDLAVSRAPVPENLRSERDEAVHKAEQFVIQVASKALEQEGREVVPGVKQVETGGYLITKNERTDDLAIDKQNQSFLNHQTGKVDHSYRPDGVLKAVGDEVTHNRMLVKDLDNFEYIERKQLTKDNLEGLRDMVKTYGKDGNVPIETWTGGKKDGAKIEKMQGRALVSDKAQMQIIESGKHLQVRDTEGNLQMKAYGNQVEKPMTWAQSQDFKERYAVVQQVRRDKGLQAVAAVVQKSGQGMEIAE
ncbi:hypothetical protein H6F74_28210 [Trichocoleus sp. FACHB-90]|uniref:hypothetical protein n=1 Tax=Cyanophyceae TaxID=3028117 RepID=UPI001687DDA9|nr:hypothetical protein [Trichocoleus sp. FACHB-90]MBD1930079.1 hypothetical protein [Trichocoleus sp. FACHB-90]